MPRTFLPQDRDLSRPADLVTLHQVTKRYTGTPNAVPALNAVDVTIAAGTFTAVVGKSGSGKSTLINMITGIDRPSTGAVIVAGTPVHTLTEDQLAVWRGRTIGIIFQFFQLLPTLTVAENVMLPMDFCHMFAPHMRELRALALLEQVGIRDQAAKLPTQLSGGQQQRAAIARALANDPPLLVADEPTGNLDSHTAEAMLDLFAALVASGKTVMMVTHERDVTRWATHTVRLVDGRIVEGLAPRVLSDDTAATEVSQ